MSKESKPRSYEQIFQEVKQKFSGTDVSKITDHLAYQFNIVGEGAGSFYVEVKEGQLYIEPYEYYDRDAIFTCKADTLFKIIEGKTDPVLAQFRLGLGGSIPQAGAPRQFLLYPLKGIPVDDGRMAFVDIVFGQLPHVFPLLMGEEVRQ